MALHDGWHASPSLRTHQPPLQELQRVHQQLCQVLRIHQHWQTSCLQNLAKIRHQGRLLRPDHLLPQCRQPLLQRDPLRKLFIVISVAGAEDDGHLLCSGLEGSKVVKIEGEYHQQLQGLHFQPAADPQHAVLARLRVHHQVRTQYIAQPG